MKKTFLTLFSVFLLSSCSAEYQERQRQLTLEKDAQKCESYGAKRGSPEFINCMATIESGREVIIRQPAFYPSLSYGRIIY